MWAFSAAVSRPVQPATTSFPMVARSRVRSLGILLFPFQSARQPYRTGLPPHTVADLSIIVVGPGGRKAYKSKSARKAHSIGIYPVANFCRQWLSSVPVANYTVRSRSDKPWPRRQEPDTGAIYSNDPVRRI